LAIVIEKIFSMALKFIVLYSSLIIMNLRIILLLFKFYIRLLNYFLFPIPSYSHKNIFKVTRAILLSMLPMALKITTVCTRLWLRIYDHSSIAMRIIIRILSFINIAVLIIKFSLYRISLKKLPLKLLSITKNIGSGSMKCIIFETS